MALKTLVVAAFAVSVLPTRADNLVIGSAELPSAHSKIFIETLTGPVRQRFAAAAAASGCQETDNQFAYVLLTDKLGGGGKAILDGAAAQGVAEGRSVAAPGGGMCPAALDRLRAADDRLIVLSETVPDR